MTCENTLCTSDNQELDSARKPYQPPELVVYGNISEITRAVDNKGKTADGGGGMTDKT